MNIKQAKQIKIEAVLQGIQAVEKKAKPDRSEIWYLSVLRQEDTASLKIDTLKNTWYDHGEGIGGDIIKLAQVYLGGKTVSEALQWLEKFQGGEIAAAPKRRTTVNPGKKETHSMPYYKLIKQKSVTHPALVNYAISSRRIPINLVRQYCEEIHFKDENTGGRPLFGIGIKNDVDAWEVRGAIGTFKAVVDGGKYITTLYGSEKEPVKKLHVVEGLFDFLTKELLHPMQKDEAIILLNGAAMLGTAVEKIKREQRMKTISHAFFWTHNDRTGKKKLMEFCHALYDRFEIGDMGENYRDYKDYNQWWVECPEARFIRPGEKQALKVSNDTAWNMVQNSRQNKPGL